MSDRQKDEKKTKADGTLDREPARKYNKSATDYAHSGKVDKAAKDAGKQDPDEARKAEKAGKERAKELDPAVHRDYEKGVDSK